MPEDGCWGLLRVPEAATSAPSLLAGAKICTELFVHHKGPPRLGISHQLSSPCPQKNKARREQRTLPTWLRPLKVTPGDDRQTVICSSRAIVSALIAHIVFSWWIIMLMPHHHTPPPKPCQVADGVRQTRRLVYTPEMGADINTRGNVKRYI